MIYIAEVDGRAAGFMQLFKTIRQAGVAGRCLREGRFIKHNAPLA